MKEFLRLLYEIDPMDPKDPGDRLGELIGVRSFLRTDFLGQDKEVLRELDAAVAANVPLIAKDDLPYFELAERYSSLGETRKAREWLDRYDAAVTDTFARRMENTSRLRVLGNILASEKKPLEAAAQFRLADRLPDGPDGTCLVCLPVRLSWAFLDGDMKDSALFYMERALATFDPNRVVGTDSWMIPLFNQKIGEIYESRGNRAKAVEHYRRVTEVWKNADPELQVIVNELKARIRRLTDLEGVPR
jgi:tetratricopeptide (TPR) repeat protein